MTQTSKQTRLTLTGLALLYAAIVCIFSLAKLYSYKASMMDNGMVDQTMWNILHHHGPVYTLSPPFNAQNWFGYHFSPVVLVMLPFYAIWPHGELFQIVQSLCFGFTGVILFFILKQAGAKNSEAWAGAFLYWLNPFVIAASIWDFHEIAFANIFIATALWGLFAKRFRVMLLALGLLLLTKEHYGLTVAGFGFLWGWRHRDWKRATVLMIAGPLLMGMIFMWLIPLIHGQAHVMLSATYDTMDRYSWLHKLWAEKLSFFWEMLNRSGFHYFFFILMAGLFFPLAALFYLAPASSDLTANLLSSMDFPRKLSAYHSAAIIVVAIVAGYQGYRYCLHNWRINQKLLMGWGICVGLLVFSMTTIPLNVWELLPAHLPVEDAAIAHIRQLLPPGGISAQNNIGMFFTQREQIYPFPHGLDKSAAVILNLVDPFPHEHIDKSSVVFGEQPAQYVLDVRALLHDKSWHITYWQQPFIVFEHAEAAPSEAQARLAVNQFIDHLDTHEPITH